jgi:uncharacterized protein
MSLCVAHDLAARRVGSLVGHARPAERRGIRQSHMAVVATHEHRCAVRRVVDQRPGRKFCRVPLLVVPVTAEHPLARVRTGPFADSPRELGLRRGVLQVDALELRTTVDEMHVRVVEPGNDASSAGVDHPGARAMPVRDIGRAADLDDPLPDDGERLGFAQLRIACPDLRVRDDEVGRGVRRTRAAHGRAQQREQHRARLQPSEKRHPWRGLYNAAMAHSNPPDEELARLLTDATTIAMVGASSDPEKSSNGIMRKLQSVGYRVIPVNPTETEILGERSYPSLLDIPERIDIVDVFRRAEDTPSIADDAVTIGAKALWLQSGITNEDAAARARAGGLTVVMDACIAVTHTLLRVPRKASSSFVTRPSS